MPVHQQSPYNLTNNEQFCDQGHSILKDNCHSCKILRKEWYSYLTKTGFEDIEKGLRLVAPTEELSMRIDFANMATFNAKRDYYQWAQECLTTCSFDSMVDRLIWQYHSEGFVRREIGPLLGYHGTAIDKRLKKIKLKLTAK